MTTWAGLFVGYLFANWTAIDPLQSERDGDRIQNTYNTAAFLANDVWMMSNRRTGRSTDDVGLGSDAPSKRRETEALLREGRR